MTQGMVVLVNGSLAESLVNFRANLISSLVARGHQVHVSAPGISPEVRARLDQLGALSHQVRLARTGLNPLADLRYYRDLRWLIKEIGADFVLSYTAKPNIWGSLAAARSGVQSASMVTGLGFGFIDGVGLKRWLVQQVQHRLYALATKRNSAVIFQNPDDERDFIAAGCLRDPAKARLVNGSGVDTGSFAPEPLPSGPRFLMIARLLASKGVREYVAAAHLVRAERPDCDFALAGFLDPGPDGISAEELAQWQAKGIRYLGQLDDVRPAIADASVYVLPSYREGTPRTVLEAMAMARPVITTDAPGCRETVVDGVNGLLVPCRDSAALADAMRRLAADPSLRQAMGAAGRQRATARYSVEEVSAATIVALSL